MTRYLISRKYRGEWRWLGIAPGLTAEDAIALIRRYMMLDNRVVMQANAYKVTKK